MSLYKKKFGIYKKICDIYVTNIITPVNICYQEITRLRYCRLYYRSRRRQPQISVSDNYSRATQCADDEGEQERILAAVGNHLCNLHEFIFLNYINLGQVVISHQAGTI